MRLMSQNWWHFTNNLKLAGLQKVFALPGERGNLWHKRNSTHREIKVKVSLYVLKTDGGSSQLPAMKSEVQGTRGGIIKLRCISAPLYYQRHKDCFFQKGIKGRGGGGGSGRWTLIHQSSCHHDEILRLTWSNNKFQHLKGQLGPSVFDKFEDPTPRWSGFAKLEQHPNSGGCSARSLLWLR